MLRASQFSVLYTSPLTSFPYPAAYHINMGVDTPIGMPQAGPTNTCMRGRRRSLSNDHLGGHPEMMAATI